MRWLESITDSVDLSIFRETGGRRSLACCSSRDHKDWDTTLQLNNKQQYIIHMHYWDLGLLIIPTSTPLFLKPMHRFCYQKWVFPAAKLHWERTVTGSVLLIRKLESRDLWWFKQDSTANKVQGLNLKGKSHLGLQMKCHVACPILSLT